MHFVYTHCFKNDYVAVIKQFIKMVKVHFNMDIFFLITDNEQTLGNKFKGIVNDAGIIYIKRCTYTRTKWPCRIIWCAAYYLS
jgi:hypothetical protein